MIGSHNQVIYYLVYGTKHWKGLEVMKEAMWKVDRRGTYTFSDLTDINQTYLIDYEEESYWVPDATGMVFNRFKGQTTEIENIHRFVITDTPYIFRKSILVKLENEGKIIHVDGRQRRGKFPDGCIITFSNKFSHAEL